MCTPEIVVWESGPSAIQPNTSEQLRISGNNTPLGTSKNLELFTNVLMQ